MQLIHDKGKHNKFWSYDITDQYDTIISWGRLGTKGQSKTYKFNSKWAAQSFADGKTYEKFRKGYKEVDEKAFGLKQLQAELIGSNYKIAELAFVKRIEVTIHPMIAPPNRNLYKTLEEASALADPTYEPLIFCCLQLAGKQPQCLLIDAEKVYSCCMRGIVVGRGQVYTLEDIKEITESSEAILKRIRDKAPALVAALIR